MSGAFDKSAFDGNTILLKISEENGKHRYVYIGGYMISSFPNNDKIYKYISNMGINLTSYSIAIGYENNYFLTPHFKFIKKELIDEDDFGKFFDYHDIPICKKLRLHKIHSKYDENIL